MNSEVKRFIENNIDLIEDNKWEEIYKKVPYDIIREFNVTLLQVGINPLDYLNYIPAFYLEGTNIKSFIIPNNINIIGYSAFRRCSSLTNILIPDSVTNIENSAFSGCYSLTNLTIPDSVTNIGEYTFFNCNSLTSIVIGNNVTSIGNSAFSGCNSLTNITIPNSVTSIGNHVFYNCIKLTNIYYKGISTQWQEISKDWYWNMNVPTTIIHCVDGDVEL